MRVLFSPGIPISYRLGPPLLIVAVIAFRESMVRFVL
jgi:hypothetical protein